MKTGFVYILTNKVNKKLYIGKTVDIGRRFKEHKSTKSNQPIHQAIKKHGWHSFEVEVFDNIPVCDLDKFEMLLIERLNVYYGRGYNADLGGKGGSVFKPTHIKGTKHYRLTFLCDTYRSKGATLVDCICDCGTKLTVRYANVRRGNSKSCGCIQRELIRERNKNPMYVENIRAKQSANKGDIWNHLELVSNSFTYIKSKAHGKFRYLLCGNIITAVIGNVKSGNSTRCRMCARVKVNQIKQSKRRR